MGMRLLIYMLDLILEDAGTVILMANTDFCCLSNRIGGECIFDRKACEFIRKSVGFRKNPL